MLVPFRYNESMKPYQLFALMMTFFSLNARANEFCDLSINSMVGLDGPAVVKDGRLSVNQTSPDYRSMVAGESAKVMMKYYPGDASNAYAILTDVVVKPVSDGLVVSKRADASQKFHFADVTGYEARFRTTEGKCEPVYNVAIFRQSQGELKRALFDLKYCNEVRAIIGKLGKDADGKEKLNTCTELLGDIAGAYNARKSELAKDGIMMSDSDKTLADGLSSPAEHATASTLLSLMSICSPVGWSEFSAKALSQRTRVSPPVPGKTTK